MNRSQSTQLIVELLEMLEYLSTSVRLDISVEKNDEIREMIERVRAAL